MKYYALLCGVLMAHVCLGQVWPFAPAFRYSNTVYQNIDSLIKNDFQTRQGLLGNKLPDRFFDTRLKGDSIVLNVKGEELTFRQKTRKNSHNASQLLYSRRPLFFRKDGKIHATIDYMKVTTVSADSITARVIYKRRNADNTPFIKEKVVITLSTDSIEGLYIGPSRSFRDWAVAIGCAAVVVSFAANNMD